MMKNKFVSILLIISSILLLISHYLVYKSSVDEKVFYNTAGDPQKLKSLKRVEIENKNYTYPNINKTTIPLTIFKALYYSQQKDFEKAKVLFWEGKKHNPYLYISEANLSEIYLKENNLDSAFVNAKKAFENLPYNERHATLYQSVAIRMGDLTELQRVYDTLSRYSVNEAFWSNHLYGISKLKVNDSFSKDDKIAARKAVKLFPYNTVIQSMNTLIVKGVDLVKESNYYDKRAKSHFANGNFEAAICDWQASISVLPTEPAYYFNIAQSQTILEDIDSSKNILHILKDTGLNFSDDGRWDFLMGMNYLSEGNNQKACEYLIKSARLRYKDAKAIVRKLGCR